MKNLKKVLLLTLMFTFSLGISCITWASEGNEKLAGKNEAVVNEFISNLNCDEDVLQDITDDLTVEATDAASDGREIISISEVYYVPDNDSSTIMVRSTAIIVGTLTVSKDGSDVTATYRVTAPDMVSSMVSAITAKDSGRFDYYDSHDLTFSPKLVIKDSYEFTYVTSSSSYLDVEVGGSVFGANGGGSFHAQKSLQLH